MTTATATYTLGKFVWRELFTRDVAAAKRFYGELFGWTTQEAPMGPDWTYTLIYAGDKQIGGMMDLANVPNNEHVPPHWQVYVSVADVDAAAAKAVELGGKIISPCMDIPNIGRFAVVQDRQGAILSVFRNASGDGEDGMPGVHDFCWESLTTVDAQDAVKFWEPVAGWTHETMTSGDYTGLVFCREGDKWIASVAQAPAGSPCAWMTYVAVASLDAANAKAKALGATIVMEKIPVEGIGAFSVIQDPGGVYIAMFENLPQG